MPSLKRNPRTTNITVHATKEIKQILDNMVNNSGCNNRSEFVRSLILDYAEKGHTSITFNTIVLQPETYDKVCLYASISTLQRDELINFIINKFLDSAFIAHELNMEAQKRVLK